jgi:hypothetical protein
MIFSGRHLDDTDPTVEIRPYNCTDAAIVFALPTSVQSTVDWALLIGDYTSTELVTVLEAVSRVIAEQLPIHKEWVALESELRALEAERDGLKPKLYCAATMQAAKQRRREIAKQVRLLERRRDDLEDALAVFFHAPDPNAPEADANSPEGL